MDALVSRHLANSKGGARVGAGGARAAATERVVQLMTVDDAKEAILERICPEWRRAGEGASWDRIALQRELDIPPSIFSRAIVELVADGFLAFMAERPTDVRLADAGVALCESADE